MTKQVNDIINELRSTGYHGLIDIELFYSNNQIYLNEFNLRSSGSSFAGHSQNFLYAVDYVNDAIGKTIYVEKPYETPKKAVFTMTEYSDIRYPLYHKYGWKKWISEIRKVDDFAYFHLDDPVPMLLFYFRVFIKLILNKAW